VRRKRDQERNPRKKKREHDASEGLTFLEKLVLRVLPTRQVPEESGVRFAVSSKAKEDGICLVFHVDDPEAPIFDADSLRPDYLVVHASKNGCVLTIVEMKGTEQKNLEHGVEQIRVMYRRLREEMQKCLPGSSKRAHIQGVLLMPYNAQLPWKKIESADKEGIRIFPLQYGDQAELYRYVSTRISRTERYQHEKLPRDRPELNGVEQLIAEGKLDQRVRDAFFRERRGANEDTFFLSFRRDDSAKAAHTSVSATTRDAIVGFTPAAAKIQREVEAHLAKHGLACPALRTQVIEPSP
jgi:hypothetical protein